MRRLIQHSRNMTWALLLWSGVMLAWAIGGAIAVAGLLIAAGIFYAASPLARFAIPLRRKDARPG